jgi:exopolyphosphatase/guanosine-5'-triphosphate,3'-diphosphate pyrophosphatase
VPDNRTLEEYRFAAIDIGSNAIRLLIMNVFERDGKPQFKKRSLIRVPIRLGHSVFQDGIISEDQIEALIEACKAFKHLMNAHKVSVYRCFATSAMRSAGNSNEVIALVKSVANIDIELIDGQREAGILYSSGAGSMVDKDATCLYVDVGGGSTELTLFRNGERIDSCSFKLGTVRLVHMQELEQEWLELKNWITEAGEKENPEFLIGTGGNIRKLYRLSKARKSGDNQIDGEELEEVMKELQSLTFEERVYDLKLNTDRADVIIPAGRIFTAILDWSGCSKIHVPRVGLADGMILELYNDYRRIEA